MSRKATIRCRWLKEEAGALDVAANLERGVATTADSLARTVPPSVLATGRVGGIAASVAGRQI